jgi:long-chain acyl-CoA synthetase
VQELKHEVPTMVFRPSMIIGDSQTGETPNFNVFYYLVKLAAKGRLKALPTMKSALIDMVPSDYVATAMCEIVNQRSNIGNTFHLCSGRDRTPTMNDIFELMTQFFSDSHAVRGENTFRCPMMLNPTIYKSIISPVLRATLSTERTKRLKNVELYIPYTTARKIFDTSNTAAALEDRKLDPPLWQDYYANIFQFCVDNDWKAERLAV